MTVAWQSVFDTYGIKQVTKTDKGKGAYVPTREQRAAIAAAGIAPATTRPAPEFDVIVLFDIKTQVVKASYYHAERSAKAKRTPEPRMGHGIISSWLNAGDYVVIGNLGAQLFAAKLQESPATAEEATAALVKKANRETVFARAKKASGKPARRSVVRDDFVRNPYVVQAAMLRADGRCEMPECSHALFTRDNGAPYLEVHHVVPLGEDGDDTLANAAALCPHCHRELHFGKDRDLRRTKLAVRISALAV